MSRARPRRSVQEISYKDMMDTDPEDIDSASSVSDMSYKDLLLHPKVKREDEASALDVSSDLIQLPTAEDILKTKARIRTQTAKIAAVETEYKVMKQKMAAFEAKRLTIINELRKDEAYLARIRTLPQEILGMIFVFYISDPAQSPWTLMQVTRAWRATALATRAIWAKIRITSPAWQKAGASRRKEGREMCGTKGQLYRALRRAGNAPLDIQLALINPICKRGYRKYDKIAIYQMISLLVSSRRCLQVHHLEIEGPDYYHLEKWDGESYKPRSGVPYPRNDMEDGLDSPLERVDGEGHLDSSSPRGMNDGDDDDMESPSPQRIIYGDDMESPPPRRIVYGDDVRSPGASDRDDEESPPPLRKQIEDDLKFPELRTLHVKSRGYVRFVLKISQTSKFVTSIDYVLASPDRAHWIPNPFYPDLVQESRIGLEIFAQCPALVSLSLNGRLFDGGDAEQAQKLEQVLDNAPSITTLELTSLSLSGMYARTPLRLPNLQHLIMKKRSNPWSLEAPRLTTISFSGDSEIPTRSRTSSANNFPLLTSLTVDTPGRDWCRHIKLPLGGPHTLDLCFGTRKLAVEELVRRRVEFNPVVFCLRKTVIPTKQLINILDYMDRLEELQLEQVAIKKEFFDYLAFEKTSTVGSSPGSSPSDEVTLNCPRLVRLQVKLRGGTRAQNKTFKAAARKAVKARVKAGIAMETWLIRSSEDQKWLNYLA